MLSARRKFAATGALLAVVVSTSAGLALAQSDQSAGPVAFDDAPSAMTNQVTADQLAFPALRRPQTAADTMPAAVAAQVGNPDVGGKNVALARAIKTSAGDGWVIPGNGSICLAVPDAAAPADDPSYGVTCNTVQWAHQHGLSILLLDTRTGRGDATVVAPDRTSVTLAKARTQSTSAVAVNADGVASVPVEEGDAVVIRTQTGGAELPVPGDD